ncbi:activating signal cointegrator 1-like [Dendronephthya gigantea]|uniref:activating signal cointegrator 1-like n=1 Tax=Dendronephthya gigantea TaxID=151771 RepID=UPI00106C9987|nr:activating signal cointegrator 1-like [Dendronephthya gigantea]
MVDKFKQWCRNELSKLLSTDVGREFSEYLFSIESKPDVEEYLFQLLDKDDVKVQQFVKQLLLNWHILGKKKQNEKRIDKPKKNGSQYSGSGNEIQKQTVVTKGEQSPVKKKSSHFISLYSDEGQARSSVRLPGRHPCECLGQKHSLVNNCLQCGRIVCEQEGSGPCYFCGEVVCTAEEREVLAKNSKRGQKLKEKLLESWNAKASEDEELKRRKATELKDRLLEYDRTSVRRTKVIDDESDYFASDSKWLSKKERKILKEKEDKLQKLKHGSRRDKKVTLDFAGRKIIEEKPTEEINELYKSAEEFHDSSLANNHGSNHPKYVAEPPLYVEDDPPLSGRKEKAKKTKVKESSRNALRIQDKELLEMTDEGKCLSMHQPWASLLVCGIKKAEGRSWYTTHRGRLWIAATAKQPNQEEIKQMEAFYKALGEKSRFPEFYPSACLLGCIDVVECLTQQEYNEQFPDGEESSSAFVFIPENPRELVVKFPVKGQHKIWKLDKHIHQAARKGIT